MRPADDLVELVGALRAPFGLERSVKIVPGSLFDDRCLLSLHRDALGPEPLATLAAMTTTLGAPDDLRGRIATALAGADIVHFGHEADDAGIVRKLYFEYAGQARAAMDQGTPVEVHLAFKWRPGAGALAVTHYRWAPCRNRAEAAARVAALVPAEEAPRALGAARHLLSRVAALADAGRLPILEVAEPGHPRRSCDINVYDADLRLAGVAPLLAAIARDFAVPRSRMEAVFGGAGRSPLGHLAAGVDRRGRQFVTLYHGVEAAGTPAA